MNFPTVIQRPSAFLPIAMSLAALALVLGHVAVVGVAAAHQLDEGAAAHIFQLLIALQLPIVAFFALRWLRRAPRVWVPVLALQAAAIFLALAPVYFFKL